MMKMPSRVHTAATLAASFAARHPNAMIGGSLASITAAAAGQIDSVQAGAVKGFAAVNGELVWVKAIDHFYTNFELIQTGDIVQVSKEDGKRLVNSGRAVASSQAEADATAADGKKAGK